MTDSANTDPTQPSDVLLSQELTSRLSETGELLAAHLATCPEVSAAFTRLCSAYSFSRSPNSTRALEASERLYETVFSEAASQGLESSPADAFRIWETLRETAWNVSAPVSLDMKLSHLDEVAEALTAARAACAPLPTVAAALDAALEAFEAGLDSSAISAEDVTYVQSILEEDLSCNCGRLICTHAHSAAKVPPLNPKPSRTSKGVRVSTARPPTKGAATKLDAVDALAMSARGGRARRLASRGAVLSASYDASSQTLTADVSGSASIPYPVHISGLHWSRGRRALPDGLSASCPCPDHPVWCKHALAALYVWAGSNGRPDNLVPGANAVKGSRRS